MLILCEKTVLKNKENSSENKVNKIFDTYFINNTLLLDVEKIIKSDTTYLTCKCCAEIYETIISLVNDRSIRTKIIPNLLLMMDVGEISQKVFEKCTIITETFLEKMKNKRKNDFVEDNESGEECENKEKGNGSLKGNNLGLSNNKSFLNSVNKSVISGNITLIEHLSSEGESNTDLEDSKKIVEFFGVGNNLKQDKTKSNITSFSTKINKTMNKSNNISSNKEEIKNDKNNKSLNLKNKSKTLNEFKEEKSNENLFENLLGDLDDEISDNNFTATFTGKKYNEKNKKSILKDKTSPKNTNPFQIPNSTDLSSIKTEKDKQSQIKKEPNIKAWNETESEEEGENILQEKEKTMKRISGNLSKKYSEENNDKDNPFVRKASIKVYEEDINSNNNDNKSNENKSGKKKKNKWDEDEDEEEYEDNKEKNNLTQNNKIDNNTSKNICYNNNKNNNTDENKNNDGNIIENIIKENNNENSKINKEKVDNISKEVTKKSGVKMNKKRKVSYNKKKEKDENISKNIDIKENKGNKQLNLDSLLDD